jgi:hypothetical protein
MLTSIASLSPSPALYTFVKRNNTPDFVSFRKETSRVAKQTRSVARARSGKA